MDNDILLKVDPNLTFCINTQIKEQLKWLIGIEKIKTGEMLPPANQMADLLGINRNTVNLVYNQLRDEGYVSIQKGRGTQVIDSAKIKELQKMRQPMHELVTKTIAEAEARGIPLTEFFTASLAYILLHHQTPTDQLRLLFVECKGHDHTFYRDEIKRVTGAEIKTVFLEDLLTTESVTIEALDYSNVVVTTLNHSDEVKKLFARYQKNVLTIGATIEMPLLLQIAQLKPGSQVSFVCLGKAGGQWMASRVQDANITHIQSHAIGIDDEALLTENIEKSDKVYASAAVYSELKALAPDKVELYPMVLEKSSENLLQEFAKSAN
ncbi:GntR family transcriptional regulator [Paenibacillus naphthalenovorans]|uniref:GntR family transcriptional regulator n=1 Tax=Paenibacillus naphthalenovorans TaxID=162209 RepID=UPI00087E4EFE|nr:GntR family transcriptional regulator [Paenibacillus naphthalenovorans]SDI95166.1 GntR family transcriptional regulator [Paenibacillus naphthalenovorans]